MPKFDLTEWRQAHPEVQSVLAAVTDLNGVARGKRVPIAQLEKLADGGLRMPVSVLNVDVWGRDIDGSELVYATGDADGICRLTDRGVVPVSWLGQPAAVAPMWMHNEDGSGFDGDPRQALARVVAALDDYGLSAVVATELEFYLYDPSQTRPQPPVSPQTGARLGEDAVLSVDMLQQFDGIINGIYAACAAQGVPADAAIAENGAGQFEINLMHQPDPLRAADDAVLFRQIVRGVARQHGMAATFMAKPYADQAGSGLHIHASLLDGLGRNIFDERGEQQDTMLLAAVGGVLETMHDLTLIFAPHENSYRRLRPGAHAPNTVCWGHENRTAAIRIPGGDPAARRIEHRVAGADANPYLVLAAVLGGMLAGIEDSATPPAPLQGDAYSQDLPRLPRAWGPSIEAFAGSHWPERLLPKQLCKMLIDCKVQEHARFAAHVSDLQLDSYLDVV